MTSTVDTMKKFMNVLDTSSRGGLSGLNEAVQAVSRFSSANDWIQNFINECNDFNTTNSHGYTSVDNFLAAVCDINLNNQDTGAITGKDAGGLTIKTPESIIPENNNGSFPTPGSKTTIQGLTVKWPTTGYSGSTLTQSEQLVLYGLNSWWINESLNLINESYGLNFYNNSATISEISVKFNYTQSSTLAYVNYSYSPSTGKSTQLNLSINMYHYNTIKSDNENGASDSTTTYLDRVIAHELTHAIMASTVDYAYKLPQFAMEGLAELVHGIDDARKYTIRSLCLSSSRLSAALNLYDTSTGTVDSYAAGYMALRYLAKQGQSTTDYITFTPTATMYYDTYDSSKLIITESAATEVWLDSRNKIKYDNIKNIDASSSNGQMILAGDTQQNTIISGRGNSSIWGGAGNVSDTLQGGTGATVFYYGIDEGNDIIQNYDVNKDMIYLYSGSNVTVNANSSDILLNIGAQHITVKNTAGSNIIVQTSDGLKYNAWIGKENQANTIQYNKNYNFYAGGNQSDTLIINESADIWMNNIHEIQYQNIDILDARNSSGFNILAGSNTSNLIIAGTGFSSLWGGDGNINDTLQGGGIDEFYYGMNEGNDLITNSNQLDKVVLYTPDFSYASAALSGTDLVISTTGGNTLTIQNWENGALNTFETYNGEQYKFIHTPNGVTYDRIK